jgi:hypothetical protein
MLKGDEHCFTRQHLRPAGRLPWRPPREQKRMWVLIYIFSYSVSPAATNDRAEWRLLPTVVFQEFSSEERCRAAKSKIEATLKQAGDKLKSGLDDLKRAGAADPAQIIIAYDVECLLK